MLSLRSRSLAGPTKLPLFDGILPKPLDKVSSLATEREGLRVPSWVVGRTNPRDASSKLSSRGILGDDLRASRSQRDEGALAWP